MEKHTRIAVLVVVLLLISLPYLLAALLGGSEWVFGGFLLNPMDGASYLAKMRQGFDGMWRFTLPFTAQSGAGAYLFLFYLGLGHLARLLGLPLVVVFHMARAAGAVLLVVALDRFLRQMFPQRPDLQRAGAWLNAVGAGMGWLVVFFAPPPADFWVAEAYPFLSMYANPHFPIGLALLLWSFSSMIEAREKAPGVPAGEPISGVWGMAARAALLALIGLMISIILPFGVVVMLLVAGVWLAWELAVRGEPLAVRGEPLAARSEPAAVRSEPAAGQEISLQAEVAREHKKCWLLRSAADLISLGCLGGPFLLYQYWAAVTDPLLSGWNAQNVTPTPPLWDVLLSFSPAFMLAVMGIWMLLKGEISPARRLAVTWFVLGLVLAVVPFALQRRFLLGFYIPTTALALCGMIELTRRWPAQKKRLWRALFGLALPSTVLLIVIGLFGALGRSPLLYLATDEARALDWIANNTPPGSLIVAAPDTGRWIPGISGRRVIYGHPFETIHAEDEKAWVTAVYTAGSPDIAALNARGVDYLIYGPRERQINPLLDLSALAKVFDSAQVQVFSVREKP